MKSFAEKYKPGSLDEIPQPVAKLRELVEKKEPVLIYGPAGAGKTTAVYALARAYDYEIVEFNASDLRNKAQVESVIRSAVVQQSLFGREKIVLIDEMDGLSGMEDRGGAIALARLLDETKIAVVLIANDAFDDKLKEVKKRATVVEFPSVKVSELVKILQRVCVAERIVATDLVLKRIAVNANGDMRAALNDLQANTIKKTVMEEGLVPREYETDVVQALNQIFKTRGAECAHVLENLNVDLDELASWLDENLPAEYGKNDDLARAYEWMARADVMQGRIRRWQYWRLLVYRSLFLSAGVSLAKDAPYHTFTKYKRTMRGLKIWQANMRNAKKKTIAEKLARYLHTSKKHVLRTFSTYREFLQNEALALELKLDADEQAYVRGD